MPVDGASVFEAALGEECWLARGFRVCRETGTRILLRDCGALGRAPPCLVTRDVGRTIKEGFGGPLVRGVGSPRLTERDMLTFEISKNKFPVSRLPFQTIDTTTVLNATN